jgi:hypothetical protein
MGVRMSIYDVLVYSALKWSISVFIYEVIRLI